jgi:hypothetical protein
MEICLDVVLWTMVNAQVVEAEFCLEHEVREGDNPVGVDNQLRAVVSRLGRIGNSVQTSRTNSKT